ncbi:hypothetical protein QCA50_011930 [Cerrena zonata]|uniref:CxC2-like cysteine cluster KDZ transposase-associated domain-containing protein n=1 Tax=Cerrena zonata TaxID=2478898 RepID=A0AAW0FVJ1_9APHY
MSKSQSEISGDRLSSDVANYMCKLFKHSLAVTTLHPNPPVTPVQPPGWSEELLVMCQNTVRTLVVAFTNIEYISWDFADYCADCKRSALGCGGNPKKEEDILHQWPPEYHPTVRVNRPQVFADPSGRIISWILPSIIPPAYQDTLHEAVQILQPWFDKRFHAPEDGGSWRNNSIYFDADNDYISTGLINVSATWYMAGHKGPAHTTPLLQRLEGHEFLSLAREPFAVMSGILAITHPKQYNMAKQMKERLMMSGQCTEALQRWPMVFTAISVITNWESPYHRDLHEGWQWFNFLVSFGPYKYAPLYLANLGVRVDNPPGTICLFGGKAILHGVRRVSPRITLALYMRQNIQEELGIQSARWITQQEYDLYVGIVRELFFLLSLNMAGGKRSKEQYVDDALNDVYLESSLRSKHKCKRKLQKIPLTHEQYEGNTVQNLPVPLPDVSFPDGFEDEWLEPEHHDLGRLPVRSNNQNDLLREFIACRDRILRIITERDAPPVLQVCGTCNSAILSNPMQWRCHSCFGEPVYCSQCIRKSHQNLPFHTVSRWDGNAFHQSSLSKAGLTLNLGHCGKLCPAYYGQHGIDGWDPLGNSDAMDVDQDSTTIDLPDVSSEGLPPDPSPDGIHPAASGTQYPIHKSIDAFLDVDSDEEDDWRDPTTGGIPLRAKKPDRSYDIHHCPLITAVHATGVHELRIHPCRCDIGRDIPIFDQMLYMGLYPASSKKTRTVFTFEALHDYDIENLETKASAAKHYDKLTWLTANAFPTMVPGHYRELLRIAREWRNLKARQRAHQRIRENY